MSVTRKKPGTFDPREIIRYSESNTVLTHGLYSISIRKGRSVKFKGPHPNPNSTTNQPGYKPGTDEDKQPGSKPGTDVAMGTQTGYNPSNADESLDGSKPSTDDYTR